MKTWWLVLMSRSSRDSATTGLGNSGSIPVGGRPVAGQDERAPGSLGDQLVQVVGHGRKVLSTTITGYWKDTGNVADMLEVSRLVLEGVGARVAGPVDAASELIGRVVVEAGAGVAASRIAGPVIVGAGSRVSGSHAGPFTPVARDCAIADSGIEYSIVLAGAWIRGVRRTEASLIGRDVEVTPSPRVPKARRLVLGDHGKVQISS